MSISYSGIIGNKGKGTLPSVESWGTDNNILRDPHRSITTRRIDKVNSDGSLNEMMYHSGDRFAENILVFPRGINPSVSVEYGNVGKFNSSSSPGNGAGAFGNGAPGKLPYRILTDGAYRPPILRMEQLMPLSRQPRLVTQCLTNQKFVDYSKTVQCPTNIRQVHTDVIHPSSRPTRTVKFQQPVREHFELKYVIENPLHSNVSVNLSSKANLQTENQETLRQVLKDVNHYSASSGIKGDAQFQNYIHDDMELERNTPLYAANTIKSSTMVNASTYNPDITLSRNMPEYNIVSNVSDKRTYINVEPDNEYKFDTKLRPENVVSSKRSQANTVDNRDCRLPETLEVGGFFTKGTIHTDERDSNFNGARFSSQKHMLAEFAQKNLEQRRSHRFA